MRLLIVDDEALARQRLRNLLAELENGIEIVAETDNGLRALELCRRQVIDLVLLDIRMPLMDGIETARALARLPSPPAIVFVTAYDQHALQAFESSAIDYLLKPIRRERLVAALEKANVFNQGRWQCLRDSLPAARGARSQLVVQLRAELQLIPVSEIVYFRAAQKYVVARTLSRELLVDESLKALAEEYAGVFLRIHRNALVALQALDALVLQAPGLAEIRLRGVPERLPVSRRHLASVRAYFKHSR